MRRLRKRVLCPFCGHIYIDLRSLRSNGLHAWCQCAQCGARGPKCLVTEHVKARGVMSMDPGGAISGWNGAEVRKLTPEILKESVAALRLVKK